MSDWLRTLLGVEDREIPADAVTSFEFANVPRGTVGLLLLLCALCLVAGVFWVYRREGSASPRVKLTLAALRALVFACAFLLILEPVLAVDQVEEVDKHTVVIVDDSLSMTTRDRYRTGVARDSLFNALGVEPAGLVRHELVAAAFEVSTLIDLLAHQNEVHVFRFSDGITPHATIPRLSGIKRAGALPGFDPADNPRAGLGTNIADAIRQAVEDVGSDRVAAIILITDGRSTLGPPAEDIALFLKNKALKLHTVVVGEAEAQRNLRAVALAGPDRLFKKDPVTLEAQVSAREYPSATVEFRRRYTDGSDDWESLESREVIFPEGGKPASLTFQDRPPREGAVEYQIKMEHRPEESTHRDNEKSFITRVVEDKARVLLVSGGPAHEYYAIKNVLLRDATIQVACFLQNAAPEFPQDGNGISLITLPDEEKDLFKFDVIILHDPDGTLFPADWPAMVKRFVSEHRGGLCFVAGNKHTLSLLRSGVDENDLTGILPVILDLDRADMPGIGIGYGAYFRIPWRMVPEPAALTHPATRVHSDPRRARDLVWDRLPPFYWFFPVLKAKPGATVLAVHEDPREVVEPYGPRPILATHRYGGGNVMFMAADETHRWRSVAEHVFDRFWVQTVRFLLEGRHSGAKRRFRIYLDREVVDMGEAVQITAKVFTETYEPFDARKVTVLVKDADGEAEEVILLAVEGKVGHFNGSYSPARTGDYELRAGDVAFRPKKASEDQAAASFMVVRPDREMGDVRADRGLLKDLAARTHGEFRDLWELKSLGDPKLIPPATERIVTQGRPIPLWDTWTTIIAILILLCAEWILRKRFRMV